MGTLGGVKPPIILRPFGPQDFAALAAWFRNEDEVWLWGGRSVRFPVDDVQLGMMLREASEPPAPRRCWSAMLEGSLAGHGQAVREGRSSIRLARLAVAPALRRAGVARAMIGLIIEELLKEPSISQITLNVYRANAPARALYKSMGFVETKLLPETAAGSGWDILRMALGRREAEALVTE